MEAPSHRFTGRGRHSLNRMRGDLTETPIGVLGPSIPAASKPPVRVQTGLFLRRAVALRPLRCWILSSGRQHVDQGGVDWWPNPAPQALPNRLRMSRVWATQGVEDFRIADRRQLGRHAAGPQASIRFAATSMQCVEEFPALREVAMPFSAPACSRPATSPARASEPRARPWR